MCAAVVWINVIIEVLVSGGRTAATIVAAAVDGGARSDGGDGTYNGAHGNCAGEQ